MEAFKLDLKTIEIHNLEKSKKMGYGKLAPKNPEHAETLVK